MIPMDELKKLKIAIPGKMTSAFLLLQLMIGKFEYVEMNFAEIPKPVLEGKVNAGLVIHETQLSYDQENLTKIRDRGGGRDRASRGAAGPAGLGLPVSALGF